MIIEYGPEGLVSIKCDVYSYEIMLIETFTRTKPNDEMFDGELSLMKWVYTNGSCRCQFNNATG